MYMSVYVCVCVCIFFPENIISQFFLKSVDNFIVLREHKTLLGI